MRGGRGGRGRGGRGRGEGEGNTTIITRHSAEKGNCGEEDDGAAGSHNPSQKQPEPQIGEQQPEQNASDVAGNDSEPEDAAGSESEPEDAATQSEFREELKQLKLQLELLQNQLQNQKHQSSIPKSTLERDAEKGEEFPALGSKLTVPNWQEQNLPVLPSWKDKVTPPKSQLGMTLKFVPPSIENGNHVVHIDSNDIADLVNIWERAVVVYVVGGICSVDILRGFIRKHWTYASMPTIHVHEEGYFILKFSSEEECSEVLNGGPYFLNRVPMIVKKWSINFDFKDEILRVIPVWIRLPSLPLHCWGEETLSRIVSAVGVPVLTDECTAKQLKVSYARVFVEIDVTKEFVKEITIRDNNGREFTQKAIPEWRPFFCQKCNKLGHECKETSGSNDTQNESMGKEILKQKREEKVWIPATIAKLMQGIQSVEELRTKINQEDSSDKNDRDNELRQEQQHHQEDKEQAYVDSQGWTPVPPGKVARRGQIRPQLHTLQAAIGTDFSSDMGGQNGENQQPMKVKMGTGTPQFPHKNDPCFVECEGHE